MLGVDVAGCGVVGTEGVDGPGVVGAVVDCGELPLPEQRSPPFNLIEVKEGS